jgi:hypothetical protein
MPTIERVPTLLVLLALLAGCAAPRPPERVAPPPPPPPVVAPVCEPPLEAADRAARHVVAQQERLATLPPAELTQEASRPIDGATPLQSLVDVSLALSLTRQPGDLAKAQVLIDQVIRQPSPQADPWRGIARLLAARYAEQRRAEEVAERTVALLRDTQRDNQRRLDQLNEKLEALKAIERSLNTRPPAPASRPGP